MALFDFDEFSNGYEFDETPLPYDEYLTVKAFLEMHCGRETGGKIYDGLRRMAERAAEAGTVPGIVFNDEGGEFVSFEEKHEPDSDIYNTEYDG